MTIEERAREILRFTSFLNGDQALDYVKSHLSHAQSEGVQSGIEMARQAVNEMFGEDRK